MLAVFATLASAEVSRFEESSTPARGHREATLSAKPSVIQQLGRGSLSGQPVEHDVASSPLLWSTTLKDLPLRRLEPCTHEFKALRGAPPPKPVAHSRYTSSLAEPWEVDVGSDSEQLQNVLRQSHAARQLQSASTQADIETMLTAARQATPPASPSSPYAPTAISDTPSPSRSPSLA